VVAAAVGEGQLVCATLDLEAIMVGLLEEVDQMTGGGTKRDYEKFLAGF